TTWKIPHEVKYFVEITNKNDLFSLCQTKEFKHTQKKIVLGKGANTLFSETYYNGMVIRMKNIGAIQYKNTETHEYWQAEAGQDWCDLVDFFVYEANLGDIENLTLIPGTVGAAPIQNIGAYGRSFSDICEWVEIFDLNTSQFKKYKKQDCDFGYRTSIFKSKIQAEELFIITAVGIKLKKANEENINITNNIEYGNIKNILASWGKGPYTIQQLCEAVKYIRTEKLPNIEEYGTNGSLFVNPIVKGTKLKELLVNYPALPFFPNDKEVQEEKTYKIAAGHILEKLGWRFKNENQEWFVKEINNVGVWKYHALILINYGTTNPTNILQTIHLIKKSFFEATKITLSIEINIIG
ncbi:MAG: FAD-binding protein, partial [Chitinophagaceae bacterium]